MNGARVRTYDKKTYKKCIKCRQWRPREDLTIDYEDGSSKTFKRAYGRHEGSTDGLQSICMACKNIMSAVARVKNVTQRVRHHTGTRCLTQLGDAAPENFVADLEKYLGYRIGTLVKHLGEDLKAREGPKRKLRDALQEGYHVDHIIPLSSFKVIQKDQNQIDTVVWEEFKKCWDIENLRAIPADENLAKGAKHETTEQTQVEEGKEGKGTGETQEADVSTR